MRSFNLSDGRVGLTVTNDPTYGMISYSWTVEQFESFFGIDTSAYDKVIYEPDRDMYLIALKEAVEVESFDDPTQHVALLFMQNNFNVAYDIAVREHIRNTTDPYYQMTLQEVLPLKREELLLALYAYQEEGYSTHVVSVLSLLAQLPSMPGSSLSSIGEIANWLADVTKYYFSVRDQLNAATNVEDLLDITWDFTPFTTSKPTVSIKNIINSLP